MRTCKLALAVAGIILLLAGCSSGNDPVYETDHPEHGKITLTTDWSGIGTSLTTPASYTVKVGGYSTTVTGHTNTIDNLFVPNTYRTYIYNTADNITLSGTTATANYTAGSIGWFFSCVMDAIIEKDKHHQLTAPMRQQVREITFIIEPVGGTAEKIERITATLSGAAGTLNIENDTHGAPSNVALKFTKISSGSNTGKWSATVRLLGIVGAEQKLSGTITFVGGSPEDLPLESVLTKDLANFNADKRTPFTLGGTIVDTSTETGFAATITNWKKISDSGIAEQQK